MANENPQVLSFVAGADLSEKQFYFVKVTGERTVEVCAAVTDNPLGVLQNDPESGDAALVAIGGESKVSSDEALAVDDVVGSSSDGQAQVVVVGTETTVYGMGKVVGASGAAGELATIVIEKTGRAA